MQDTFDLKTVSPEALASILKKDASQIAPPDDEAKNLLHRALEGGRVDLLDCLLEVATTVQINSRDADGQTLFDKTEDSHLLKKLIKAGLEVDLKDAHQRTLLHHMIIAGKYEKANLLLESGANTHCRDENGVSALQFVIEKHANESNWWQLLLSYGAGIHAKLIYSDIDEKKIESFTQNGFFYKTLIQDAKDAPLALLSNNRSGFKGICNTVKALASQSLDAAQYDRYIKAASRLEDRGFLVSQLQAAKDEKFPTPHSTQRLSGGAQID